MGYYVTLDLIGVEVLDEVGALNAINELHRNCTSEWGYSWVENPPEEGFESLDDAFHSWRYEYHKPLVEAFTGEKLGDDELLWRTLAPFIASGAIIRCSGEDETFWRWRFENGELFDEAGWVVYE